MKDPVIQLTWQHEEGSSKLMLPPPWDDALISVWRVDSDEDDPLDGTWVIDFYEGREYFGPECIATREEALQIVADVLSGKRELQGNELSRGS